MMMRDYSRIDNHLNELAKDKESLQKITVEIEWETPDDPNWLNADNVSIALHAYCPNTKFHVTDCDEE